MPVDFQQARRLLNDFDFHTLFIELFGWQQPASDRVEQMEVENARFERKRIAQMSEAPIFEITSADGEIPNGELRAKIYREISEGVSLENLLIFVNANRTRSLWFWAKREGSKFYPRTDTYIKGQPADLLLSKISGLRIELDELDEEGRISTFEVADRLQRSLDVEKVTKKFYQAFQLEHQEFIGYIQGIGKESDRRWYTPVILNRLMFVYFLQKKGFINQGDTRYLRKKLAESQSRGRDLFFNEFLHTLFFEGLAKPERDRAPAAQQILGKVCYLDGGLFLKHPIELNQDYDIVIPDEAFEQIFTLFEKYSWHLDDRPGGKPNEINPDVLGYIFEKYINQKAFGAYYTRPEITEYLCDRTINKLILDRVNAFLPQRDGPGIRAFDSIDDMVMHMDIEVCRRLIYGEDAILRNLTLLDPACGSGAFLIAAMKTLIRIYERVIGVVQLSTDYPLRDWLDRVTRDHPSLPYFIKKRIITDNLYGVDIMEEAVEIAKLRLFLALVTSARTVDELEPLPNIDFNIMAGNSLIGLIRVDEEGFDAIGDSEFRQGNLLQLDAANNYRAILDEKNRSIELYKKHSFLREAIEGTHQEDRLQMLRSHIEQVNSESEEKLNQLLLNEFTQRLGIKFEQARLKGRAKKRNLTIQDIEALKPFHWGYHFDKAIEKEGGFDAIITNPPWEVFKPDAKEFFSQYSDLVTKKKMNIKTFNKTKKKLLEDPEISENWLEYQSQYPHLSNYFRSSRQYKNQISIVNGRKIGTDINLYKLFLEQCFNLVRDNGTCGILIPSGIYTDLGSKQLREMLFYQTQITSLFGLSNEKFIFDGVHHSFRIAFLTFEKGKSTDSFTAAFRINPREAIRVDQLANFFNSDDEYIEISVPLICKLSPDSLSVMEFKDEVDVQIAKKMSQFPLLSERIEGKWSLKLTREFDRGNDSKLFQIKEDRNSIPLFSGRQFNQFQLTGEPPTYWIKEDFGRQSLIGKEKDDGQILDYQKYRWVHRRIARNSDFRTFITTIIPKNIFLDNNSPTLNIDSSKMSSKEMLFLCGISNSFTMDWLLRQKVATTLNMFYIYQLPVPRSVEGDPYFKDIVDRAAKLICTTPEFDDLAAEVGLGSHTNGVTDEAQRAQLRAQLDGMIAHLYGLTEEEFTHILSTFPIVPDEIKQAALEEYRKFAPLAGDQAIIDLIAQGESAQLEFKSTARWDLRENKKSKVMEEVVLKTVAAFLNSEGGALLIGVEDDGNVLGLQPDYQTLQKKDRDGYELWLMGALLLKSLGNDIAPQLSISFSIVDNKEVCKVAIQPSPRPVYCEIKNKNGQSEECFFIRAGNQTKRLTKPSEIANYTQTRWPS